ncbi:arrestin domain-containing protein 3-like isoform X2 [Plectropomus leopardus]|uniref:arrestin domain-containing protein 3-like isoform X1 n=1 Tax=Plectropomus leopardus TaxID=160734 RepID=UPI001C4C433D|nr:arrestin domain-containing protein 3-like isoform X1 [Plectropomus leopardus]XP_042343483.1 arrestin domain-containing protein 3-like isoform X2 [Plectropomus leopardus]
MFQQTIKNFNINFNALNERNTVSSGDVLTGHISFELTKETKITAITLALKGGANVHWSTGGGGGRKRRHRKNYSAKVEFFHFKILLLQASAAVGGTPKLQPGTHVYPFTCHLPQGEFPSSFHGPHGQIAYTLTVGIDRPWHMVKDFATELNYVYRINTNQPELGAPLSGSNTMTLCCLWCASGPITLKASIEKKAFVPGETVKIICELSNASSRTATPKVTLQQKQVYYTLNKANKTVVMKNLASVTGQPISAYTSDVHTEIMFTIPPSASPTISNCSILDIDNVLEVSLSVRAYPTLDVLFPIILCDTPVNADPPPYM